MHFATANSHYNLGLLYRLNGELIKSKKEFRICELSSSFLRSSLPTGRSIRSELFGEDSLEVATTDLSLGQTERLLISYDKSYLHFYLSFHTRALVLGPTHTDTLRAYQLLSDIRFAYSDRLLTSVELLDRIDQLGWFHLGDEESDLLSVVSSLLTHLYAARTTAVQNGLTMHYKGGIETAGGNTGTMLGDCIVLRESLLQSLIRDSVAQRVQTVIALSSRSAFATSAPEVGVSDQGAIKDWNNRLSQRGRPPPPPPSSKYVSLAFNSPANVELLSLEIVGWLLGHTDSSPLAKQRKSPLPSGRFGATKGDPSSLQPPSLSADLVAFYEQKRIAKLKADSCKERPLGVQQTASELVEKTLDSILAAVSPNEETKAQVPDRVEAQLLDTAPVPKSAQFLPPKTPPPPLNSSASAASSPFKPPTASPDPKPIARAKPTKASSKLAELAKKSSTPKKATPPKPLKTADLPAQPPTPPAPVPEALKISVTELDVPPRLVANRNKAFLSSEEEATAQTAFSGEEDRSSLQVMPRLGGREVLITKDIEGKSVSLRPTSGRDLLEGLRIKIFAAGIFPYLLMTDLEEVERSKREVHPSPLISSSLLRSPLPYQPQSARA
jgi:hypothetical protein